MPRFLIDLLAEDEAAVARLREIDDQRLTVPTLVYTEVAGGIDLDMSDRRRFEEAMDQVKLVPYDAKAARRAVDVQRQRYADGDPIDAVPVMIAGIRISRDEPLVTRNVSAFERRGKVWTLKFAG